MRVQINGDSRDIDPGKSVKQLLIDLGVDPDGVVVELNGRIITSASCERETIPADATIEIVQFVGGG